MKFTAILVSITAIIAFESEGHVLFKRANQNNTERFSCADFNYVTDISIVQSDTGIKYLSAKCNSGEEFQIGNMTAGSDELKPFRSMSDGFRQLQTKSNGDHVTGIRYQVDKFESTSNAGKYQMFFDPSNRNCRMYGFKAAADRNGIKSLEPLFCKFASEEQVQNTFSFICPNSGWINKIEAKKDDTGITFMRMYCSTEGKYEFGNEGQGSDWSSFDSSDDGYRSFGIKTIKDKVVGLRDEIKLFQALDASEWKMKFDPSASNCRWTGANITSSDYHIMSMDFKFC